MIKRFFYIKDDNDENVFFQDIRVLYDHIKEYHAQDATLHEERGYYFTINKNFRYKINKLIKSAK